jgi:uncharacterized protein YjbI with pentapeptide repeats
MVTLRHRETPAMKTLALVAGLAALSLALPAAAQNASQIAHARGGASCPKCNLFQADFAGLEMAGRNYSGARLRQADLSLSVLNRTNFGGADLRDVEAYGGVFSSSNFAGANLTHASFVGTFLAGANFAGANLEGANFSGAELAGARGLTQAQLNRACGDGSTTLPRGLRIPAC